MSEELSEKECAGMMENYALVTGKTNRIKKVKAEGYPCYATL